MGLAIMIGIHIILTIVVGSTVYVLGGDAWHVLLGVLAVTMTANWVYALLNQGEHYRRFPY